MNRKSSLERAFELAKSGRITTVQEIKLALKREGYNESQLEGPQLTRQLRGLIATARPDVTSKA
jgi:hypothetical protein